MNYTNLEESTFFRTVIVNRDEVIEVQNTPDVERIGMYIATPNCEFILIHGSTSSILLIDILSIILDH